MYLCVATLKHTRTQQTEEWAHKVDLSLSLDCWLGLQQSLSKSMKHLSKLVGPVLTFSIGSEDYGLEIPDHLFCFFLVT